MHSNYLLDTHVIIWLLTQPEKLSPKVQSIILNNSNALYFSMISLWEIAIKISLGKLILIDEWHSVFQAELQANHIYPIELNWAAIQIVEKLPFHHRDPFDRMLIAQAISKEFDFISADQYCPAYALNVIW